MGRHCINAEKPVYIHWGKTGINPHFPHGYPQLSTAFSPILWGFSPLIHSYPQFLNNSQIYNPPNAVCSCQTVIKFQANIMISQ